MNSVIYIEMKKVKQKFRLEVAIGDLMREGGYFWTLTTADRVDYLEIARRWRSFRHWINGRFPDFKYVQNFEPHPKGHGWHVHFVCNAFLDLRDDSFRSAIPRFGFGRVSVEKCDHVGLHDYLTKHAMKAFRRLPDRKNKRFRLVNVSRSLCCPLSRFQSVFGLSDRWNELRDSRLSFSEKSYCPLYHFEG